MTKIKNTKKGMAKKTLSISLAVAMLATSNVPVWAAEDLFTDGSEAVFTSEAEVAEETPAVEETEAPEAKAPNANGNYDSRLQNVRASQKGWASKATVTGNLLDHNMNVYNNEDNPINYQWVVAYGGGYLELGDEDGYGTAYGELETGDLSQIKNFIPGKEILGKDLYLHIFIQDTSKDNIDVYIPAGTVAKEDLNNFNADADRNPNVNVELKDGVWKKDTSSFDYGYNGKEIKPVLTDKVWVHFDDENANLDASDFLLEHRHQVGNFVDADSECEVVLTPNNTALYTGVLTQKYNITPRIYVKDDITAEVSKDYVYTGDVVVPGKEDIALTETIRGKDGAPVSNSVIDEIWASGGAKKDVGTHVVYLNLLDVPNYYQDTLPKKYQADGKADDSLMTTYKITKRSLEGCTAEIDAVALNGKNLQTLVKTGKIEESIHIYDAEGKELNLHLNQDYELVLPTVTPDKNGTYPVSIKAMGGNMVANTSIAATLTITTHDFASANFINGAGEKVDEVAGEGLLAPVPYTGNVAVKDLSDLSFSNKVNGHWETLEEGKDYTVTVTGTDAGTGRIIVEGLRSYEGAKKVLTFKIEAAHVTEVDVKDKVVFNPANTAAADYAPTVKAVKAENTAAPAAKFTLTEGKDYTVKYEYVTRNELNAKIRTTVSIINPNFKGGQNVWTTDKTVISKKSLENCEIKVLGTYTYTGAEIIPDVEVRDGDEILVKDVDYIVKASNNINVGDDAVVTVYGKIANGETNPDYPNGGIYDKDTYKETTFSITPADAKDVEVKFYGGNTGVQYTGKPIKPTIMGVYLNGNDVTEQFQISYPGTYINVGKGMVVLTPVNYHGHTNFVGTKDATYTIAPRKLEGDLYVWDKDGRRYTVDGSKDAKPGFMRDAAGKLVNFDYDGKEHTFAGAEFVPSGDYSGYVTENDYEIKYVDNVYGGTAYIYVAGKGNFAGNDVITDAEDGVINSVVENTAYKYTINTYKLKEQHVEIGNAEYAGGQAAKPSVTVTVLGQKLVEGKDYVIEYGNRGELTNGKTEKVVVKGIKAFGTDPKNGIVGYYAVVKRDMANTDVVVNEKSNGKYDVVVYNSGMVVPASEYTVSDDGHAVTVTAVEGSKYYEGSKTVDLKEIEIVKPETPVITDVDVTGNKATVILSGATDGATGYDYVISKDRYCTDSKAYDDVNKNILSTKTDFNYVQEGVYYAYCHSWVRDENGQKVFSDWSNGFPFVVTSITPDTPKITSVKVKGSTVTVTYTKTANASGYDVVLGSEVKRIAGEKRPINYGTLVAKNIKGDKVTATFKNVPAGTYYAGLHAFNRTSEDGKKVFSPWSLAKTVKVK